MFLNYVLDAITYAIIFQTHKSMQYFYEIFLKLISYGLISFNVFLPYPF